MSKRDERIMSTEPERTAAPVDPVAAAYGFCADVTRREARNFYYGIRLLPPPKRSALCAVYALARRIDDIGDEPGTPT